MYPILFEYGPFLIPAWHAFYVFGAFAAYFSFIYSAKKFYPELDKRDLAFVYIYAYLGGYFGARLLSIFIDEPYIKGFVDTLLALSRIGPMTFYGGFIGAVLCGYIFVYFRRLPPAKLLDLAVPSSFVALALGRVGCFLNGDDYGKAIPLSPGESPPWWAVNFPNLEDSIYRYPVQLIATISVSILVLFVFLNFKRIKNIAGPGSVASVTAIGYGVLRFMNEFLRGDPRGWVIEGVLSPSQFISLIIILFSGAYLVYKKHLTPPPN